MHAGTNQGRGNDSRAEAGLSNASIDSDDANARNYTADEYEQDEGRGHGEQEREDVEHAIRLRNPPVPRSRSQGPLDASDRTPGRASPRNTSLVVVSRKVKRWMQRHDLHDLEPYLSLAAKRRQTTPSNAPLPVSSLSHLPTASDDEPVSVSAGMVASLDMAELRDLGVPDDLAIDAVEGIRLLRVKLGDLLPDAATAADRAGAGVSQQHEAHAETETSTVPQDQTDPIQAGTSRAGSSQSDLPPSQVRLEMSGRGNGMEGTSSRPRGVVPQTGE